MPPSSTTPTSSRPKGAVKGVEIAPQPQHEPHLPGHHAADDPATTAFVAYLLSAKGLATVQSFGFGAP